MFRAIGVPYVMDYRLEESHKSIFGELLSGDDPPGGGIGRLPAMPAQAGESDNEPSLLGILRKSASQTWDKENYREVARAERLALQAESRRLLEGLEDFKWIRRCMVTARRDVDLVEVKRSADGGYFVSNVFRCGSWSACPMCAAKIAVVREAEMRDILNRCEVLGFGVFLLTYTLSHGLETKCAKTMNLLTQAKRLFKGGRAWVELQERLQVVGSVKALEVTHNLRNGYHPHEHELLILRPGGAITDELVDELKRRWVKCVALAGGVADYEHGVTVVKGEGTMLDWLARYLSKTGRLPKTVAWDLAREMSKGPVVNWSGRESRTSLALLRASQTGDKLAARVWGQYAVAAKGKRQLSRSRGLDELLGLRAFKTDEQVIEEADDLAVTVLEMSKAEYARVVAGGPGSINELLLSARRKYENLSSP